MAAEKEHESKTKHEGGKKPRKHLHQIVTTRAHDGTFSHEHIYKANKHDHHSEPPVFAGTSAGMEDLHQHMDDHFGNGAPAEQEPDAGAGAGEGEEEAAEGGAAPQQV